VESSYHGSALLYRLLQDYPSGKLMVMEAEGYVSLPPRRLLDVPYLKFPVALKRLRYTRFSRLAASCLMLTAGSQARRLRRAARGFRPEAILTVAHGHSWLAAARYAEAENLPLHLIVHDHCPDTLPVLRSLKGIQDRYFRGVYRRAASRLCVSPFMEEEYSRCYGMRGQVLYPSRAKDCPLFDEAPPTYGRVGGPLRAAYAGNIVHAGYVRLIRILVDSLERRGGLLLLYGPHSREQLTEWGLNRPSVVSRGLIASGDLISRLRDEADFLFVPMAFDADGSQFQMTISFPSKITDYTATGVPLLICGPEYCSAVQWAKTSGPVAEVVTTEDTREISAAAQRLEDNEHRKRLGQAAMQVGDRLFSHTAALDILYSSLRASSCSASSGSSE
jgi:hypothetical protein